VSEEKRKFDLYDRTHKSRSDLQRRCQLKQSPFGNGVAAGAGDGAEVEKPTEPQI